MKMLLRLLASVAAFYVTSLFLGVIVALIPPDLMAWGIALDYVIAVVVGVLVWERTGNKEKLGSLNFLFAALALGGTGYIVGTFGTLLVDPDADMAFVYGLFLGVPGLLLGAVLGLIMPKRHARAFERMLRMCGQVSLLLFVMAMIRGALSGYLV